MLILILLFQWTTVDNGLDGEQEWGAKDNCQVSGSSSRWSMMAGAEIRETGEKQNLRRRLRTLFRVMSVWDVHEISKWDVKQWNPVLRVVSVLGQKLSLHSRWNWNVLDKFAKQSTLAIMWLANGISKQLGDWPLKRWQIWQKECGIVTRPSFALYSPIYYGGVHQQLQVYIDSS